MIVGNFESVAVVSFHGAARLSNAERLRVASWLLKQANALLDYGDVFDDAYCSRLRFTRKGSPKARTK
jgi:hypothetical protein